MLKKILSISEKPGLFRLISYGKNMVIVEELATGRRLPAHARDRIVSLGDISIYTTEQEVPLAEILQTIFQKEDGAVLDMANLKTDGQLDAFFKEVLPNYDEARVYKTDIKKIIKWYNLLVEKGITDFTAKEDEEEAGEETQKED